MMKWLRNGFAQRRLWLNYVKDNRADITARLRTGPEGEVVLFSDRILKRQGAHGELHTLENVTASVENIGGLSSRGTFTRAGINDGWQKRVDDRQMFLSIDGPEFAWLITVPASPGFMREAARGFAQQVNLCSRIFNA